MIKLAIIFLYVLILGIMIILYKASDAIDKLYNVAERQIRINDFQIGINREVKEKLDNHEKDIKMMLENEQKNVSEPVDNSL